MALGCVSDSGRLGVFRANLITATVYYLFAMVTVLFFSTNAVWPAAGVTVGAVLLYGRKILASIFVATVFVVLGYFVSIGQSPLTAENLVITLLTAIGNSLSGWVCWQITGSVRPNQNPFSDTHWLFKRFIPAAFASGLTSAIFGVGVYELLGQQLFDLSLLHSLATWTISNAVGVVIIAPVYFMALASEQSFCTSLRLRSMTTGLVVVTATVILLFGPFSSELPVWLNQPHLIWIPIVWAMLYYPQFVVSILCVVTFYLLWITTALGYGPFAQQTPDSAVTSMQVFAGISFTFALLIQALVERLRKIQARLRMRNSELRAELEDKVRQLEVELVQRRELEENLRKQAATDPLTGLQNRRSFLETADRIFDRSKRHNRSLTLLVLDIDHFKLVNDTYGHDVGDEVLRQFARELQRAIRSTDYLCRWGGEEFIVLLPETGLKAAGVLAEKLRNRWQMADLNAEEETIRLTMSIGCADLRAEDSDIGSLIHQADKALYRAKHLGRNRVCSRVDNYAEKFLPSNI